LSDWTKARPELQAILDSAREEMRQKALPFSFSCALFPFCDRLFRGKGPFHQTMGSTGLGTGSQSACAVTERSSLDAKLQRFGVSQQSVNKLSKKSISKPKHGVFPSDGQRIWQSCHTGNDSEQSNQMNLMASAI
jgi:hypothetical protein